VNGATTVGTQYVSRGQHHTLDLELNRQFTLWKTEWDSVARQQLQESLQPDKEGALAAVVMDDQNANVCIITDNQTLLKERIRRNTKGRGRNNDTTAYFERIWGALSAAVEPTSGRRLLLASPGFTANEFKDYIRELGGKLGKKEVVRVGREAIFVHSDTNSVHSLNETLKQPDVVKLLSGMRSSEETAYLDRFWKMFEKEDGRAWYGTKPVQRAVDEGAVGRGGGVLLINNDLFRSLVIETRKKYVAIVDRVKDDGGEVRIFSSDHEGGNTLSNWGGIAAMLTYPLLDLDEDPVDDDGGDRLEGDEGEIGDDDDDDDVII
jgi:protein pelota